jgi:SAM-dependent methyltransferase
MTESLKFNHLMNVNSEHPPACPVCRAPCPHTCAHYTAEQAAAHFCPPSRNPDRYRRLLQCIQRLWRGDTSDIRRCETCGFGFGWPFVGGDEEFYGILHEQMGYTAWSWDFELGRARVVSAFPSGGKILDIGAGCGHFLHRIDPTWEKHAVEGSELTRRVLRDAGIQVHRNLEQAQATHAGSFDLITIFQVLEHLSDFSSTLASCRRLLKPGGRILITVPDGDAIIRQEKLTGCPDMPPNHINKWTPASLAFALREAGLEPDADAVTEPRAWKNVTKHLHLRVMAEAANGGSLAATAYRVRRKRLRVPLLAAVGGIALLRLIGHWHELRQGGAFAQTARRNNDNSTSDPLPAA